VINKMIKAAMLNSQFYEEVEHDRNASLQAGAVVALSAICGGLASIGMYGITGLIAGVILGISAWLLRAGVILIIGTKFLRTAETEADYGQLIRTMGFASSPGLIRVLGIVPFIGTVIIIISEIWILAATIVAVRQALDFKSTLRAISVVFIGELIVILLILIISGLFN
jgi:hypothetical protein